VNITTNRFEKHQRGEYSFSKLAEYFIKNTYNNLAPMGLLMEIILVLPKCSARWA
jgi:hypothetical protein